MALSESKVAVVADANAGGNSDSAAPPPEPPPPPPMANHIGPSSRRKSSVAQRLPAPGKRGSKFRRGTQLETVSESGTFEGNGAVDSMLIEYSNELKHLNFTKIRDLVGSFFSAIFA